MFKLFLFFLFLFLSTTGYCDLDSDVDNALKNYITAFQEYRGVIYIIAAITVLTMGLAAFKGKISWLWAITVGISVFILSYAGEIAMGITGQEVDVNLGVSDGFGAKGDYAQYLTDLY